MPRLSELPLTTTTDGTEHTVIVQGGVTKRTPITSGGLTTEQVQDTVAAMVTAGTGISKSYDDGAGTLTITNSSPGGGGSAANFAATYETPLSYGWIGDGGYYPMSSVYPNLAAAQAAFGGAYSFVTSMSDSIDWAACQAASNAAFGPAGSEHSTSPHLNKRLLLPNGYADFHQNTWTIRNLIGADISGAGKLATALTGQKTILAFDGLWHSTISNILFRLTSSTAIAAVEVDGNIPGHPYTTRGTQGITIRDIYIDGGGSDYCFALNRQGGNAAQGDHIIWENPYFENAKTACLLVTGYNTMSTMVIGGNIAQYKLYGIYCQDSSISVLNTTFQCGLGNFVNIVENGGADIHLGNGGVGSPCVIAGVDSESIIFLVNAGAVNTEIIGARGRNKGYEWGAGQTWPTGEYASGNRRLWKATTGGTTGSVEPNWAAVPVGGTYSGDGAVTWQEVIFYWLQDDAGAVMGDLSNIYCDVGRIKVRSPSRYATGVVKSITAAGTYRIPNEVALVKCDCSSGNIILIPDESTQFSDYRLRVVKLDNSANTVKLQPLVWGVSPDGSPWGSGKFGSREYMVSDTHYSGGGAATAYITIASQDWT